MLKLLNAGKYNEAAAQFGRWVYSTTKQSDGTFKTVALPGLVKRRHMEMEMFKKPL